MRPVVDPLQHVQHVQVHGPTSTPSQVKSSNSSHPVQVQLQVQSNHADTWIPMLRRAQISLSPRSPQSAVVRSKHTQDPQSDGCTPRASLTAACEHEEVGLCRRRLTLRLVPPGPRSAWYLPPYIVSLTSGILHRILGWRADGGVPSSTAVHLFYRDALPHQVKSKSSRSQVEVKSKSSRSQVEVKSKSSRSQVEVKSKSILVQSIESSQSSPVNRVQSSSPVRSQVRS